MRPLSYTPEAAIASAEELLAQLPNTLYAGNTFLAPLSSRLQTLTPSLRRALWVG